MNKHRLNTYEDYKTILNHCTDYTDSYDLEAVCKLDISSVQQKCNHLFNHGYLAKLKRRDGNKGQWKLFYKTINKDYNFDQYVLDCNIKARNLKPKKPQEEPEPVPAGVYRHNPDAHKEKYRAQQAHMRSEYKSGKVFVGSSFGMI